MDGIHGGAGHDQIWGGDGNGFLFGDAGDDSLYGGRGRDSLAGGDGNDGKHQPPPFPPAIHRGRQIHRPPPVISRDQQPPVTDPPVPLTASVARCKSPIARELRSETSASTNLRLPPPKPLHIITTDLPDGFDGF
jgi:hypothetical protein